MRFLHIDCRITACDHRESIGFRSLLLTGLYRFTLSHCGSRTPLPTLKPHLTAPAPRLCTGCLLGFTGFGIPPNCIICTELAHPYANIIAQIAVLCLLILRSNFLFHLHYPVRHIVTGKRKSCGAENAHTAYEDIQFCYRSKMLLR